MRIAICEDEKNIAASLESNVLEYGYSKCVPIETEIYSCGEQLLENMKQGYYPDLLFLDIELPGINGVKVGREIREHLDNQYIKIIFVSGKNQYDRQLFDVRPMHFLEKPVRKSILFQDLDMAIRLNGIAGGVFTYKKGRTIEKIAVYDILYFESTGRKIQIHTRRGIQEYYGRLKEVETQVGIFRFLRIQRSYLVNYTHIGHIYKNEMILKDGTILFVSRSYKESVRGSIMEFETDDLK